MPVWVKVPCIERRLYEPVQATHIRRFLQITECPYQSILMVFSWVLRILRKSPYWKAYIWTLKYHWTNETCIADLYGTSSEKDSSQKILKQDFIEVFISFSSINCNLCRIFSKYKIMLREDLFFVMSGNVNAEKDPHRSMLLHLKEFLVSSIFLCSVNCLREYKIIYVYYNCHECILTIKM